jgi:hypothetical protein
LPWRKDRLRDSSSDEERVLIEDEDMKDAPTDTSGLWMPEKNEDDTKFVRDFGDDIPTKKCAQAESELIVQERKQIFKDLVNMYTYMIYVYVCTSREGDMSWGQLVPVRTDNL